MSLLYILISAVSVSLDGFFCGATLGMCKIKIRTPILLLIALVSGVCCFIAMVFANAVAPLIKGGVINYIGAGLMFVLCAMNIYQAHHRRKDTENTTVEAILEQPCLADIDNSQDLSGAEGILLGLAVALDASICAISLSLAGANIILTPAIIGITHLVLIALGLALAKWNILKKFGAKFKLLPASVFAILAIVRLFG